MYAFRNPTSVTLVSLLPWKLLLHQSVLVFRRSSCSSGHQGRLIRENLSLLSVLMVGYYHLVTKYWSRWAWCHLVHSFETVLCVKKSIVILFIMMIIITLVRRSIITCWSCSDEAVVIIITNHDVTFTCDIWFALKNYVLIHARSNKKWW